MIAHQYPSFSPGSQNRAGRDPSENVRPRRYQRGFDVASRAKRGPIVSRNRAAS